MKNSLKRFERLENTTLCKNISAGTDFNLSKRFMKLEINDRKIEVVMEDKVSRQESIPQGKEYYFLCPYCGKQNNSNVEICAYCKRQLKNQYIPDYSGRANQLKKCHCGAMNLKVMELLDKAHTQRFGNPVPTEVETGTKKLSKEMAASGKCE